MSEVAQSCPTLCDPMDCSLPGSSIHGILQARLLEWVAISFSNKIDSQWESAVSSGNSNRGSESTERGGMGREVQKGGDICIPMADSC